MKQPFFTIIIPTLNEEKFLPRLLSDLVRQSFRDFEVIVVDGKSKDATVAKAHEFSDKLPQFTLIADVISNVGYQRNVGAQKARGTYLVFFDADVQLPRNYLSKIRTAVKKNKWMLLTTYLAPDSSDMRDWVIMTVGNIGMEIGNLLDKPFVGGFNIFIHTSVFQQVEGFDPKLALSEDHELVQRCHSAGVRMAILHDPRIRMSLRRFRREGYFTLLRKYAQSSLYYIIRGPIKKAMFEYEMGGQLYTKNVPVTPSSIVRLERWLLKTVRKILEI